MFLMKEGTTRGRAVRDDIGNLASLNLQPDLDFGGEIRVKPSSHGSPSWLQFVRSGTPEELPNLATQSAGALAVLTVDDRVFCVSWGNGRHWIEDRNIERRFGMIVTLNTVDPTRIRSVDRDEFETVTRTTRSQLSVSSSIDSFGVDVQRDLVRSVTGTPEDPGFAAHITGSDNLILNVALTFAEVGGKCRQALAHYREDRYKQRGFGWIDNFVRVRDRLQIAELENRLSEALHHDRVEDIFLSPPTVIESQEHRGFRYPNERAPAELHNDLRLEDFLRNRNRAALTVEWLKRHKIREYANDAEEPTREYSVFDAIVYEARIETKLYVLSQGEWFEIDQNYVNEVGNELQGITENEQLRLPDARAGEGEPAYNVRAAGESGGNLALLDTPAARVAYGGGHSIIEICDLLSLQRDFVHVKAKTKSSTLSHLFAQGTNSAQAFRDVAFRRLAAPGCPESHRHIFGDAEIRPAECSVTFAIITRHAGDVREALPFFSKQSLVNAARTLRNMGYRVFANKVQVR